MMRKISKYEHIFFMNQILLDTKVKLAERSCVVAIVDHGFKIENRGSASAFDLSRHDQRLPQQPYSRTSSGSCALIRHIKYVSKIITLQLKTIAI